MMNQPMRFHDRARAISRLLPLFAVIPAIAACTQEVLDEKFLPTTPVGQGSPNDGVLAEGESGFLFTGTTRDHGSFRMRFDGKLVVESCDATSSPDVRDPDCDDSGRKLLRVVVAGNSGHGISLPAGAHAVRLEDDDGNVAVDFGVVDLVEGETSVVLMYDAPAGIAHRIVVTRHKAPIDGATVPVRVVNLAPVGTPADLVRCDAEDQCEAIKTGIAFGELWEQDVERVAGSTVKLRFGDGTLLGSGDRYGLALPCHSLTLLPAGAPPELGVLPVEVSRFLDCRLNR